MRRMYSENELKGLVHAYLEAHPEDLVASLDEQDIELGDVTCGDITASGDVTIAGDLSVTGSITGKEILENDVGVTYIPPTIDPDVHGSVTIDYAGCVKTGNKITFVVAGTYNKGTTSATSFPIGSFDNIPTDILNKLVPNSYGCVDSRGILLLQNAYTSRDCWVAMTKQGLTLKMYIYGASSATASTDYYFRYEATFLLSENLAS